MIFNIVASFTTMAVLDLVFAGYTFYLIEKNALAASLFASAITLCYIIVTLLYVDDHWMAIPTVAGAFVGTFAAVKLKTSTWWQK